MRFVKVVFLSLQKTETQLMEKDCQLEECQLNEKKKRLHVEVQEFFAENVSFQQKTFFLFQVVIIKIFE